MSKFKAKLGDRIRILKSEADHYSDKKGHVFQIGEILIACSESMYLNANYTGKTINNDPESPYCLLREDQYEVIPKEIKIESMFKEGDYIVVLDSPKEDKYFPRNYVFKQKMNHSYLKSQLDSSGDEDNGWVCVNFTKKDCSINYDWRYATQEEIAEYEKLGKPFDVTTLQKNVPERISFYVKYCKEFTEDLYNKLSEWAKLNSKGRIRGVNDTYGGLKRYGFYVFDNWGLNVSEYRKDILESYGVDNNRQGCKKELSISDLKHFIGYEESYRYEVVHCTTEEQWNFVKSKCNRNSLMFEEKWKGKLEEYPEGVAISVKDCSYCGLNWWKEQNSKIYSFQEWCDKFQYKPEFMKKDYVGRYVKALVDVPIGIEPAKKGDIFKVVSTGKIQLYSDSSLWVASALEKYFGNSLELLPEDYRLESVKPLSFQQFGIDPTKLYDCQKINDWQCKGHNRWDGSWNNSKGGANNNRTLSKIEYKDGVPALYVSGTNNAWIRAEGFIEFYYEKEKLNPEHYIEEAKRRFPAGTVFNNNNLIPDVINDQAVSSNPKYKKYGEYEILVSTLNGADFTIWKNGEWANVIFQEHEFVHGEYYSVDTGSIYWIIQFDRIEGKNLYTLYSIVPQNKSYYRGDIWSDKFKKYQFRKATKEEIRHIKACEYAGKYVDDPVEYAKKRYPIGTKVKSLFNNYECTITKHSHSNYLDCYQYDEDKIWFSGDTWNPVIYDKGKWAEIVSTPEKKVSEFKVGDVVMIDESQLPIKDNWLGENGRFTHQGPYRIDEISGITKEVVTEISGIRCALGFSRFRYATDEEKQRINRPFIKETIPDENWEPQVGDWAVIATLNSKSKGSMNGKIGHVFQIKRISHSGYYEATSETWCIGGSWPIDCIRKALPHEIPVTTNIINKLEGEIKDYLIQTKPDKPSELNIAKKSNQISAEVKNTKPLSFTIKQKSKTIKF